MAAHLAVDPYDGLAATNPCRPNGEASIMEWVHEIGRHIALFAWPGEGVRQESLNRIVEGALLADLSRLEEGSEDWNHAAGRCNGIRRQRAAQAEESRRKEETRKKEAE